MNRFTIQVNKFLKKDTQAFYHTTFYGSKHPENPNYLYKFKNDPHHNWSDNQLNSAKQQLTIVLSVDLPQILQELQLSTLTVCVVPRS